MGDSAEPAAKQTGAQPRSPGRRVLRGGLFLLYLVVVLEVGSRAFWMVKYDLPVLPGQENWYGLFYEELELSKVLETDLRGDDEHFDVLLLGGSVLYNFGYYLGEDGGAVDARLRGSTGVPVRTFNLAYHAMTTRDSLTKYRLMDAWDKHFDLVVIYHGVNDTRMNNCPRKMFRDDYTHMAFYDQIERMEAKAWLLPLLQLPFTAEYAVTSLMDKASGFYLPSSGILGTSWTSHGTDVKTEGPFRDNLQAIFELARRRSEKVLLVTFPWYIPENYTCERYLAGQLDYAEGMIISPVETWGTVAGVSKGLTVHNRVIRELAAANQDVLFVDIEAAIPREGTWYRDVCHLTMWGYRQVLEAIAPAIEQHLRSAGTGG